MVAWRWKPKDVGVAFRGGLVWLIFPKGGCFAVSGFFGFVAVDVLVRESGSTEGHVVFG